MRRIKLLAAVAATLCLCAPAGAQVQVTPDAGSVSHLAGTAPTDMFVVRNTSGASATYSLQGECSGTAVSDCVASRPTVTLATGDSALVAVSYFFPGGGGGGLGGGGSVVRLKAFRSDQPAVRDSGDVQVSEDMGLSQPASMRLDRDDCVVAAAGPGAFECGDLRLAHALPSTRVLGTARTPTLLYNSQHARPFPLVPFTITPALTGSPFINVSEVRATLLMGGATVATRNWLVNLPTTYPTDISPPLYRFAIGFDASSLATGVHNYTLQVTVVYSNGNEATEEPATGQLVVVNRVASPFGAGWWVAGLESLYFPTGDGSQVLWVGGDGSYRLYHRVTTNTWVPDAWDRPDTLRYQPDSLQYVRTLPGRVEVRFDQLGRHVRTRNKAGHWSTFEWSGSQLARIHLPRTASFNTGYSYLFEYNNTGGRLSRVVAPGTGREVAFAMSSGRITSIAGPDTTAVGFTYAGTSNIPASRTDRRGISTTFSFDPGQRLTRVTNTMGTVGTGDDLSIGFTSAETMPYFDGVLADSMFTEIDGPRPDSDVVDKTRFYVSEAGVPRQVRNALGYVTTVVRGDARWPGLVTEVFTPYGRTTVEGYRRTSASYDARGNLLSSTDWSTQSTHGRPAVTLYAWNSYWDAATEITAPTGEVERIAYDSLTGQRAWEQRGGATRRVQYSYYPMSHTQAPGLVRSITHPAVNGVTAADSVWYDAYGNLAGTRTPMGVQALVLNDGIGRVVRSYTQIDSAGSTSIGFQVDSTVYDAFDRPVHAERFVWPARSGEPDFRVVVNNQYDQMGNVLSVSRSSAPDSAAVGTIVTQFRYDAAGRVIAEIAPDAKVDSTAYDPAGNVTRTRNRRGYAITAAYDVMGRLVRRITPAVTYADTSAAGWTFPRYPNCQVTRYCIPGDTVTFTYDVNGALLTARNRDASIRRSYLPSGLLDTDSTRIRTYAELSAGGDTTSHVYGLRGGYDIGGRQVWLKYPQQLGARFSSAPWVVYDSAAYAYDPETGALASVRDVLGNEFRYAYDARGRMDTLYYPQGHFKAFTYDADNRLPRIRQDRTSTGGSANEIVQSFSGRGEPLTLRPFGVASNVYTGYSYAGLGALRSESSNREYPIRSGTDSWGLDALGNQYTAYTSSTTSPEGAGGTVFINGGSTSRSVYEAGTGRLLAVNGRMYSGAPSGDAMYIYSHGPTFNATHGGSNNLVQRYDAAGNQYWSMRAMTDTTRALAPYTLVLMDSSRAATASYYGADGKLMLTETRTRTSTAGLYPGPESSEEYRYDPLGRRILRRARNSLEAAIQRFVWAGDNIAAEMQYPGAQGTTAADLERDTALVTGQTGYYGRVLYTMDSQLDQPVAVVRIGYGAVDQGTFHVREPFAMSIDWNQRGEAYGQALYAPTPLYACSSPSSGSSSCVYVSWAAMNAYFTCFGCNGYINPNAWGGWFGSITRGQMDGSGKVHKRNRFYDPATGRFTQEDPIGLAGGLNSYGFANGNPVSYSDPYGLSSQACPTCVGIVLGAVIGGGGRALYNYLNDRPIGDGVAKYALGGAVIGGTLGFGYGVLATRAAAAATTVTTVAGAGGAAATNPRTASGLEILQQSGSRILALGQHAATGSPGTGSDAARNWSQIGMTYQQAVSVAQNQLANFDQFALNSMTKMAVQYGNNYLRINAFTTQAGVTVVNLFVSNRPK